MASSSVSGQQNTGTTGCLDLLFGASREKLRLDDHRLLGKHALAEDFEEARSDDVQHGRHGSVAGRVLLLRTLGEQRPEPVEIDGWTPAAIFKLVKFTLTNFAEVTRMVLVEQGSVMMKTTSVTATTRMLAVLTNTTVTM